MSWSFKIIFYYVLGTLMEFGIMPIVESYGILLSLNAFGIINLEDTPYNNALLNGAQRCRLKINNIVMLLFFLSFLWKKNTNKLTNFVFVFFYSTCYVADGGNVCSVYNDRNVRWTWKYWGRNPHWHSSILCYLLYWNN